MTTLAPDQLTLPIERQSLTTAAQVRTAFALISRDLAVLSQSFPSFIVRTSIQPALFAFVFAYVFPRIGFGIGGASRAGGSSFGNVLVPGLMASTLMFQGIQAVALPLVQEFSYSREIEDRVMAPVPTWVVAVTKIISGAIQGCLAALIVIPAVWLATGGDINPNWNHPLLLISIVMIGSLDGAAFGLLLGTIVSPRSINLLFAVLILPLTLLGCVYYPWAALHTLRWLQIATLLNPVVYMSEGLRAALAPQYGHISLWAVYALLIVGLVVMTVAGQRLFRKRVIS